MPYIDVPLSAENKNLVSLWEDKPPEFQDKINQYGKHVYENQRNRIKSLQKYLETRQQSVPLSILLFAFIDTPQSQFEDGHLSTQGYNFLISL